MICLISFYLLFVLWLEICALHCLLDPFSWMFHGLLKLHMSKTELVPLWPPSPRKPHHRAVVSTSPDTNPQGHSIPESRQLYLLNPAGIYQPVPYTDILGQAIIVTHPKSFLMISPPLSPVSHPSHLADRTMSNTQTQSHYFLLKTSMSSHCF